jgi:hypothetical protein
MTDTVKMSLDEAVRLMQRSIEMGKYDNARLLLEEIIKQHKEYASTARS